MKLRGALAALLLCAACEPGPPVTALHDLHQSDERIVVPSLTSDFYTLPFPNDLRRRDDGSIDLSTYPRLDGLLAEYVDQFDGRGAGPGLRGAGTNAAIYFRFDGPIDAASLPADANASLAAGASAFLVDVTPGSPTYGRRHPVRAHYVAQSYDFIGPHWVALLPHPGLPLRENTTYAALLTDGLRGDGGATVLRSAELTAALAPDAAASPDARVAAAARAYRPLTDWLASQPGLAEHLRNLTVFTTGDFTSVMFRLRQAVYDQAPTPLLADLVHEGEDRPGVDDLYRGTFQSPNFQSGTPPYLNQGGNLRTAPDGTPLVDHTETLRVAITLPKGPMPAAGWPVVLYAHGTGGNYLTFVKDGSGAQAAAISDDNGAPQARLAMISIDQVLHGSRVPAGTNVELAFFNLQNLAAAHDNPKQGALDDFQLLRLVETVDVTAPDGARIKFDPEHLYFKGHSQGGLTGPLFLAAEPRIKAAVLSGAGGLIILSLLSKTKPVDIPQLVAALLRDPIDEWHPLLNLVQHFFEDADPINYAHCLFREPPPGYAPKSVFQSLGLEDHYSPVPVIEALALALGVQPVTPRLHEITGLSLVGLDWAAPPVVGNVSGGRATAVLLQYEPAPNRDGHSVVFDIPAAIAQSNRFLASQYVSGIATLSPPPSAP